MFHFKAPGRLMQESLARDWGGTTHYLEVGDDQRAVRQVDVYDNGNVLRYDRFHQWDGYGMLLDLKFSRKPKWAAFFPGAEMISGDDFERVWRSAQSSPLWGLQVASSRKR
jgi:hypothetical protein